MLAAALLRDDTCLWDSLAFFLICWPLLSMRDQGARMEGGVHEGVFEGFPQVSSSELLCLRRNVAQFSTRNDGQHSAQAAQLLTLPDEVLALSLHFLDVRALTAFALCSRECWGTPTDSHWEGLCRRHDWLVLSKPKKLSWRAFAQRLEAASTPGEDESSGLMLVIGGSATHHHPTKKLDVFHDVGEPLPATQATRADTYRTKTTMRLRNAISAPGVTRDEEGRAIVVGGWSGFDPIRRVERLDLQNCGWMLLTPLSIPRCFLAAASDRKNNIFAVGGGTSVWRGATVFNSVEVLRPGASEWAAFPSMLQPRAGHQAVVTDANDLFVAGGYGGGTDYLNTMESFDVERGWIRAPDMSTSRSGLGLCFGPDRCIYAVGGSQDGVVSTAQAERYDPRSGVWMAIPPMPIPRGYCAAAFGLSGRLYVTGGQRCFAQPPLLTHNVDIFDVRMGRWSTGPVINGRLDLAMIWTLAL